MLQPRICLNTLRWPVCWGVRGSLTRTRHYATQVEESGSNNDADSAYTNFELAPPIQTDHNLPLRTYKPVTPGIRHRVRPLAPHLWKGRPFHPLTIPRRGQHIGGRNNTGKVHVRHRGGGVKRRIRTVDFVRMEPGQHKVERIEYDPGRSAHIALLTNPATNRKSYIIAADGMRADDVVQSYRTGLPADLLRSMGGKQDPALIAAKTAWRGNCMPLHMVPTGSLVYNVGLQAKEGAIFCRSAGSYATVMGAGEPVNGKPSKYMHVRLQSGEIRKINREACATIGVASNPNHNKEKYGKAGRKRLLGIRPTVRGVAMNANEHPHGGGRGKSKGNVHPISIWGRTLAKGGYKTRDVNKSNKHVVKEKPRNFGRRKREVGFSRGT